MLKQAKTRQTTGSKVASISNQTIYNMLQDLRHLMIIDLRPETEFSVSRIRRSIRVDIESDTAIETISKLHKEIESEIKDKSDLH